MEAPKNEKKLLLTSYPVELIRIRLVVRFWFCWLASAQ